MQPYLKALAWAFWRERRTHFALFIIIASAFSVFMYEFNSLFEKYEAMEIIVIFAMLIELFCLAILIIAGFGSSLMHLKIPDHLYVKPVSSRFLVAIYLGLSILSVVLIHLITVLLYRFVGILDWPVIIPLTCLITIILCVHTIFWSLSDTPFICVSATIIMCGFMSIFSAEYIFEKQISLQYFLRNIMPYMVIIDIFALVISFHAVKHARCGEMLRSARLWERLYLRLKILLPGKNWQLRTPQKAYFWLLYRTSGLAMPFCNLLFVLIALIVFVLIPEPEKNQEVLGCMVAFAFANLFLLPFIGALMAHQEDKSFGVSYYIATRPISDRSILVTIFKAFMADYIIGWTIYFIGLAIVVILLSATGHLDFSSNTLNELKDVKSIFSFPKILLYPLGIWAAVGLTSSIFIAGRKWPIFLFCAVLFMTPATIMLTNIFVGRTLLNIILPSLTWLFAFVSIGGTLLAFIHTVRRHLISSSFVRFLISGYIVCCIIGLLLNFSFVNSSANAALLCGMLALPFAPFATAPLAMYWNRHR